jgi:N-acetylglucosamine kinase-like BadF-type ATPase
MKSAQFVVGIDGGGTKTAAVIADLKGNVLARHIAGPANFKVIGVGSASQTIFALIKKCCTSAGCTPGNIRATVIGLAGAGRPDDKKKIANGIRKFAASKKVKLKNIGIESDARIALEGAFKGGPGIVVIVGTGSIVFGKDVKGNIRRAGGWGRILGDDGSGYSIGREGLRAVCRENDQGTQTGVLANMVVKKFRLRSSSDIITAVHENDFDIASAAPIVCAAADEGDSAALDIIQRAAHDVTELLRAVMMMYDQGADGSPRQKILLSVIGGLLENETSLARALWKQITNSFASIEIIQPLSPPEYGAVLMALAAL